MGRYLDIVDDYLREKQSRLAEVPGSDPAKKAKEGKKVIPTIYSVQVVELGDLGDDDYYEVESVPEPLGALAQAISVRRMRERGEVPHHVKTALSVVPRGLETEAF
jgi:hypothetical protein